MPIQPPTHVREAQEAQAAREAALVTQASPAHSVDKVSPTTSPKPDGTVSDASRLNGGEKAPPAITPPDTVKITVKTQQGVTTDAKSASVVDLAAGSLRSPAGNSAPTGAKDRAAKKAAKRPNAITLRLTDEEYARIATAAGVAWTPGMKGRKGQKIGAKSMAAVIMDGYGQGPVPEVNRLVWAELSGLIGSLASLTEQVNDGKMPEDLRPLLRETMRLVADLRKDLLTARPPDATTAALKLIAKDVAILKKQMSLFDGVVD